MFNSLQFYFLSYNFESFYDEDNSTSNLINGKSFSTSFFTGFGAKVYDYNDELPS